MASKSWLFIRNGETVWIERHGLSLLIAGPGAARAQFAFFDEAGLQNHQITTAERLSSDGWILWGYDQDRRQRERRTSPRGTRDRRVT